jgi:uncharacterized protein (TIGR01777 family)
MTTGVIPGHESSTRMVIAISGSSGLIGTALVRYFEGRANEVRPIVRRAARTPGEISWDPERETIDAKRLEGVDAVINLAGENLAQRWSGETKRRIRDSRVKGTATLVRAISSLSTKPSVLLSGSAIGIYGSQRGDEPLDEASTLGSDFLASVCVEWESAAAPATDVGVRVVALRTGLVLSRDGGVLAKLLLPFQLGVGGPIGNGRQWMSWISIGDYVRAAASLLRSPSIAGPVNVVAPNPVTNAEFAQTLGRVIRRPTMFKVPRFALKLVMGEMADDTILASQRVRPRRLLESGFDFEQPTLESALRDVLT